MLKQRVIETNEGIQGEVDTREYDAFARGMRDRGWLQTDAVIASGITEGHALEIGPGPGYLGLEWLLKTTHSCLTGLEISENMIRIAQRNATEYGLVDRAEYVCGNAMAIPLDDDMFDAVFSSGSLHEWEEPVRVLNEAYRVLKPGGRLFVGDMKRDTILPVRIMMRKGAKSPAMKAGFTSSLNAAYTARELEAVISKTAFGTAKIQSNLFGLTVQCVK